MARGWNYLAGGWEYNFIGEVQSGTPLSLPGNFDIVGNPASSNSNFNTYFNTCEVTLAGVVRQPNAAYNGFETCSNPVWRQRDTNVTLQTTPLRTGAIRNPWAKQWDMSLVKGFALTERWNAECRAEGFNVFNTPIRVEPNTDPTSTQFGFVATNQRNSPVRCSLASN